MPDNEQNSNPNLSLKQKAGVAVLAVFGVVLLFVWAADLKNTFNNSLNPGGESGQESPEVCPGGDCFSEQRENVDSDGDGLTDWEETEKYGTSPYLEDTDGDGYSDKEEIETGHDPNCPRGEDCYGGDSLEEETGTETATTSGAGLPAGGGMMPGNLNTGNIDMEESEVQEMMEGEVTPEKLRQLLAQSGIDQQMLSSVSDQELMQAYQETLNQNNE